MRPLEFRLGSGGQSRRGFGRVNADKTRVSTASGSLHEPVNERNTINYTLRNNFERSVNPRVLPRSMQMGERGKG